MSKRLSSEPPPRQLWGSVFAALALLLGLACSGGNNPSPASTPSPESSLKVILATKDLGLGTHRISFLLFTADTLISVPRVTVRSFLEAEEGAPPLGETATAVYHEWPYGVRGNYSTQLTFDKVDTWTLEIEVVGDNGSVSDTTSIPLEVNEKSHTPPLGTKPPLSRNKTLRDVESIEELTTWPKPDPDLYQLTIEEAMETGKPTVIVLASPALCTTPTCGPQTETVKELKDKYKGQANFIHIEVYDNPNEIQSDLRLGRYAEPVKDWGLADIEGYLNESWVFILDKYGVIISKYEGYASAEELESGLKKVI